MNLNDYAIGLVQKEIVDLEVRMKYLEHQNDLIDQELAAKVAERDAVENENHRTVARQYRQEAIQKEIDKLHARQDKIVKELDEQELIQLYYKQSIGLSEEPKHD